MKLVVVLLLSLAIASATKVQKKSKPRALRANALKLNCTCGYLGSSRRVARYRIVGGNDTKPNEYPFIAGVVVNSYPNYIICGSTIITKWHAVSAAHCNPGPLRRASLILGAHEVANTQGPKIVIAPIKKFINHEAYNKEGFSENDITLIVLAKPITFGPTIGPACFPQPNLDILKQKVKIIGWGYTADEGYQPKVLQQAFVDVVPTSDCAKQYEKITDNVLCTYSPGKDACQGDSGGPVVHYDLATQRYTLVGIISYGKVCGQVGTPAVNTNVIVLRNWILRKINETEPSATTCLKI